MKHKESKRYSLAIKSMPSNRDRRDTIRQTWAKTDLMADYKIKRIFLLGKENSTTTTHLNVSDEATEYGDILQADFGENFHNLTYKDYFFLSWFESQSCQTKWVDDSTTPMVMNIQICVQRRRWHFTQHISTKAAIKQVSRSCQGTIYDGICSEE